MKLRRAIDQDVPGMLALKKQLAFQVQDGQSTRGGFLLGTTAQGYREKLRDGLVWILEDTQLEGFAIVLPDASFKQSEVWQSRHAVSGDVPIDAFEAMSLGYFDQLAVRPGASRRYSAALALTAMVDLMQTGVDAMITATVVEPVVNLAAVPLVKRMGGVCIGRLDEHTPEVGDLVSDIWVVARDGYERWMTTAQGPGASWIQHLAKEATAQHL